MSRPRCARTNEIAVAIVGRPERREVVAVNRLLREERVMVSEMPGTTRDTVDVLLQWHKRKFRILDTAGMRRPGRVAQAGQVESVSVVLAKRAMARADVVVLVIDAIEGATRSRRRDCRRGRRSRAAASSSPSTSGTW